MVTEREFANCSRNAKLDSTLFLHSARQECGRSRPRCRRSVAVRYGSEAMYLLREAIMEQSRYSSSKWVGRDTM
jgi:hypothetical protein